MAASIVNLSNGHRYKFNQALRKIAQCEVGWVEYGVTVRKLGLQEMVAARSEQNRMREPLAYAECPGITYEPSASGLESHRRGLKLVWEAHQFVSEAAA